MYSIVNCLHEQTDTLVSQMSEAAVTTSITGRPTVDSLYRFKYREKKHETFSNNKQDYKSSEIS